jgi:L-lactate permease
VKETFATIGLAAITLCFVVSMVYVKVSSGSTLQTDAMLIVLAQAATDA